MRSPKGCQMPVRSDSETSPSASLPWASSCPWVQSARRLCSSAHPTVETASPLAQQVAPLPWRLRPPHGCPLEGAAAFGHRIFSQAV